MKNLRFKQLLPLWILILGVLSSCSIGEDDNALSFINRTGKLTGQWKLVQEETEYRFRWDIGSDMEVVYYDFDGDELEIRVDSDTERYPYKYNILFDKDGYCRVEYQFDEEDAEYEGGWAWSHKSKELDLNNREGLTVTWMNIEDGYGNKWATEGIGMVPDRLWVLQELSNDRMVIQADWENTSSDGFYQNMESILVFKKL